MRTTRFVRHPKRGKAAGSAGGQAQQSKEPRASDREALLRELLDEAHARIRTLQGALERFITATV